jgi:hypothetical protein
MVTGAFIPCMTACATGIAVALAAVPAAAFVKTCHQDVTRDALAGAAWPLGAQPPALAGDDLLLPNELAIDVAPGTTLWAMSALVGNNYNDGGPYNPSDVVAIAEYAARPDLQPWHCLRRPEDDGASGDAGALAACKAYVLDQIGTALGDGDAPDLAATEAVRLHLLFRGDIDVPLQRFGFHLGQATHALQDSFTHSFRSADERQVLTVLNWVDWVRGGSDYVEARDGFQHITALDKCGASDEGGTDRKAAAEQATAQLIAAVADDGGGRAGRLARAGAVLDAWLAIGGSCTAANHWCDAPEQKLAAGTGCAIAGGDARPGAGLAAAALALALAALARRARGRRTRAAIAAIALLALERAGAAQAAEAQEDPARGEHKGHLVSKATPEEQKELEWYPFGVIVEGGIANDNGGWDVGVGLRYDLTKRFTIGLGAQYNPWVSYETGRTTRGTTQAFGVGVFRLDVRDYLELRATLAAGASVLNFDTFAAKSGSVGPYFAISPLGIAIRMSGHLRLTVDPAEIAVAIPKTTGIPLAYRQHRFSVGVQRNF